MRTVLGPVTRGAIALRQGREEEALTALAAAASTEWGTVAGLVPSSLRAEALLQKGALPEAIAEYSRLLEHRGVDPFAPMLPLAHLGLARAYARSGDAAASRRAYEELFRIWNDADPGFSLLVAARAEYARLGGTTP